MTKPVDPRLIPFVEALAEALVADYLRQPLEQRCPYSDGNSCLQYNLMGQVCQDCPIVWPELR